MLAELTYRNLDDEPAVRGHQHLHRGARPGGRGSARRQGARRRAGRRRSGARRPGRHAARVARRLGELRAAAVTAVHVVVPDGIDDPARPSGGNTYDRHVCRGLTSIGWSVHEHAVPGSWPRPDAASFAALAGVVRADPRRRRRAARRTDRLDGARGARAAGAPVAPGRARAHAARSPSAGRREPDDARTRERAVLSAAAAVVTTSAWTRRRLLELYSVARRPGARRRARRRRCRPRDAGPRPAARCSASRAVTFDKGHDVLLDALATISDLSWHCVCVGSLDRDPAFVEGLRRRALDGGLDDRVHFPGPRTGADLDRSYAAADLMVLASRAETYGMVVTEALARGVPVVAADVGGVTEALGHGADGIRPGLLVPPGRPRGTRRRAPGLARRRRAESAVAPGRPRAARVALRVVDDRVGPRRCPGRGRGDERSRHPGQHGMARPSRAG